MSLFFGCEIQFWDTTKEKKKKKNKQHFLCFFECFLSEQCFGFDFLFRSFFSLSSWNFGGVRSVGANCARSVAILVQAISVQTSVAHAQGTGLVLFVGFLVVMCKTRAVQATGSKFDGPSRLATIGRPQSWVQIFRGLDPSWRSGQQQRKFKGHQVDEF